MNRPNQHAVEAQGFRYTVAIAGLAGILGCFSCVDVNGGAVELSWSLRTPDGDPNDCTGADIDRVRLCWAPADDGQTVRVCEGSRTFDCQDERGFSRFEIDEGETAFWIEPLCARTQVVPDPATYEVPPPLVRVVSPGQVVILNALLIVASDEDCNDGFCTCRDNPSSL
ncbi:MAG: hypothetical protein KJO07_02895 [Deltaproteobacteria bacterium]|nr:hypothetical protein [Deltaproteobacteria bacterium]